jgi:diguanylate cyclase (GGDEF)-like protein
MPEAQDPGWPEMRDADDARPAVWGRDEEDEALVAAARERSEIAEMLIEAAQRRGEIADELVRQAQERGEIAEMLIKAAQRRSEIVDARERQVAAREEAVAALERDAAERGAIVNARDKAAVERDAIVNARDKAAVERDAIANARDKAAVERDAIANARDKTAAERESLRPGLPAPSRETEVEPDDAELEKARLEAQLQRAHLDALTGAYRREMGRLALRNEIDRARRGDGHFVIAFIDVDGLKGVNDRDGHAAGDRILRTLVATMRANLRSYDPIVRFGGDEFILGISSIDPEEAQHRIGVIDQSLRSATGVGITAGLASLDQGDSLDELTARADAALIEAKRNRNN